MVRPMRIGFRRLYSRYAVIRDHALSVTVCVAITLIALFLGDFLDLANIVMLFLLAVVLIAWRGGRSPAVMAAFLSVALFDFFFVPPRFSFAVSDFQYVVTFVVMLSVALIIGQLTARLRRQAALASIREQRTGALYEMALQLSGAVTREQTAEIAANLLGRTFNLRAVLLLADREDRLSVIPRGGPVFVPLSAELARLAYDEGKPSTFDRISYFPLRAPMRTRGVLVVAPDDATATVHENQRQLLETVASLLAIVIERVHYVEVAHEALLNVESERLRNSLLSALSHDLRTPLTALIGLADSLTITKPVLSPPQRETAALIRDQALRMSHFVHNILDMARLQSGAVQLRKEWQPLEEVVGSSLKSVETYLGERVVKTALPADLPLLEFDAVLIERVLFNLLDNAAKYSPASGEILIAARRRGAFVEVSVADQGPGLVPGSETSVFDKFMRGNPQSNIPGVGLGLAISRAIVEAHGGRIWATNRAGGGAEFVFALPVGNPPAIDAAFVEGIERETP